MKTACTIWMALCLASPAWGQAAPIETAPIETATILATYGPAAERIIGAALVDDTAWRRLEWLSDRIGHRVSGSPQLEAAVAWAAAEMQKDGLVVRTEKVKVPRWVRGKESATLVAPFERELVMLGLGNSVGTPPEGVEGEVFVVRSWAELDAQGDLTGKVVLYDVPFTTYGETVAFRSAGPSRAAKKGAVAALVRSVGPVSLRTPHTGALRYDEAAPKIPAAALTLEDAALVARSVARGERPRVRLRMEATMGEAESANVVGDLVGSERPDEVVLLCGHLDSWDVGQGSTDDGGGCLAAWEAVRLVKRLGLKPRRTLRVVLYVNEENGLRGAQGYAEAHQAELGKHLLAIESDSGVTRPEGIGLSKELASPRARATLEAVASLLRGIRADKVGPDGGGADVGPLEEKGGVLVAGLDVDESKYFWVHHTPADTFDKLDRTDFGLCVATLGVIAYVVADLPDSLR